MISTKMIIKLSKAKYLIIYQIISILDEIKSYLINFYNSKYNYIFILALVIKPRQ